MNECKKCKQRKKMFMMGYCTECYHKEMEEIKKEHNERENGQY